MGHGQTRRGVVTSEVCWSRAIAGTLIFSKQAPDILWGSCSELAPVGGVAGEVGVGSGGGDRWRAGGPTEPFAAFCGQLGGWVGDPRTARDPQAKGQFERSHRFLRTNFEPGRRFANHLDFQDQSRRVDAEGE